MRAHMIRMKAEHIYSRRFLFNQPPQKRQHPKNLTIV